MAPANWSWNGPLDLEWLQLRFTLQLFVKGITQVCGGCSTTQELLVAESYMLMMYIYHPLFIGFSMSCLLLLKNYSNFWKGFVFFDAINAAG